MINVIKKIYKYYDKHYLTPHIKIYGSVLHPSRVQPNKIVYALET